MTLTAVTNARLILHDGVRHGALVFEDDEITSIIEGEHPALPESVDCLDAGGRHLAAGLVDVHVHGGGGFDLMTDDVERVRSYARWVTAHGVTSYLVSTSGPDHATIVSRLRAVAPAVGVAPGAARVLGFHLEGPYINPARRGAFDPRWLRTPSASEYRALSEAADGEVRQVTLAPELPGAETLIDAVLDSGAVAAIGHTDASYDEAMRGIARGISHVTHCFNAMRPFGHRDAGCLGAILGSDAVTAELIGDGAHVAYEAARVLVRAKGVENVVLVTDAMPLAGTPDGETEWAGMQVVVEGGKAVRKADGVIVGSVMTLDRMVRNAARHLAVPLEEAFAMASAHPAEAMRAGDRYGTLAPGFAADFILLDDELRVTETWVAGQRVYRRESG